MPIGTINNGDSGSSARTKINAALTVVDGLGNASTKNVGTSAGDVAAGDDTRFSDARTPTDHAGSHTDGTDDIQNATASQKGLATATQITKLDGIEAGADVTDAGNVAAAGALMTADLGTGVETALGVNLGSAGSVLVTDYAADAGSTDAYVAALNPAPAALVDGAHYRFKANTANNGAATINFNSLGAKAIVKAAGGITTALADNDIRSGQWVDVVWDGVNMQMQSTLGNSASGGIGGSTGATDNALIRADGTGGASVQSSSVIVSDDGDITIPRYINMTDGIMLQWGGNNNNTGFYGEQGKYLHGRIGAADILKIVPTGIIVNIGTLRLKGYTVGTLPTSPTAVQGDTAYVTDALAPVSLATVASGGSVIVKVFYNGTNWIVQ